MNNKIKKSKMLIICIAFSLFISSISTMNAMAATSSIEDYKKVIEFVNEKYNQHFDITDTNMFNQNVCNKVTLDEFEAMLISNASQGLPVEYNIEVTAPDIQARASNVYYYAPISHGSWSSRVNAFMEVDSTPAFISFISAGYLWSSDSTSWYFKPYEMKCLSLSSSSCKVSYKGYWTIPKTGLADLTEITYTITYSP